MEDNQNEETQKTNVIPLELSPKERDRAEVIQTLLEPCDRAVYGQKLRAGAEKLGISVRSLQRLFKRYQEEGLFAVRLGKRRDRGSHRVGDFWEEFIIKTYQQGNKGSKRMNPKQVALKVQAKATEIGDEKPPNYRTILRILKPIIEKKKKSIRSPGWQGSSLSVKTRDGFDVEINYSNQVWQCDHTRADILLVDQDGNLIGRPWLTTVIDSYSRCIVGINLGYDAPSSQVVALALRHAILPKKYGQEYKLNCEWDAYGLPKYLFTDGGKDFRSNHLQEIATELGFVLKLRNRPSEGGIVERPFKTFNQSLFSTLPGYTGSNVKERPKEAEKEAQLTLRDLERLIVRFIVDKYNQSLDARSDQTRYQRWESGLPSIPEVISERDLDICLMKQARRQVQRSGYIQFENIMYKGEYLEGYAGKTVSLRYNPRDITTVWIYQYHRTKEEFLTRAHAQGLETEQLSLDEAKASAKRLREKGKTLTNDSILQEFIEREATVKKKTRKQRQKEEQTYKPVPAFPKPEEEDLIETQEEETNMTLEIDEIEVWDLEAMREDYEW